MKLSISITENDVAALDEYITKTGTASRSAAVQVAIQLLRYPDLEDQYVEAFAEHEQVVDETVLWDTSIPNGIGYATR